jgi:hypothetical protein
LFRRVSHRFQRQMLFGIIFDFFQQILHGRINWKQTGFKASRGRSLLRPRRRPRPRNFKSSTRTRTKDEDDPEQRNLFARTASVTLHVMPS